MAQLVVKKTRRISAPGARELVESSAHCCANCEHGDLRKEGHRAFVLCTKNAPAPTAAAGNHDREPVKWPKLEPHDVCSELTRVSAEDAAVRIDLLRNRADGAGVEGPEGDTLSGSARTLALRRITNARLTSGGGRAGGNGGGPTAESGNGPDGRA